MRPISRVLTFDFLAEDVDAGAARFLFALGAFLLDFCRREVVGVVVSVVSVVSVWWGGC